MLQKPHQTIADLAKEPPAPKAPEGSIAKGTQAFYANATTGQYTPLGPSHDTKAKMRKDPDLAMSLAMLAAPIKSCPWTIECEDPQAAAFLTEALKPVMPRILAAMESALAEGWQGWEKIYTAKEIKTEDASYPLAVVYGELLEIPPRMCNLKIEKGELKGISIGKALIESTPGTVDKALVVTMPRTKWLEWSGEGRYDIAYDDWYSLKNLFQFLFMYVERKGDPPVKGRAPRGMSKDPITGEEVDNLDYVLKMGMLLKSRGTVALDSTTDEKGNYLFDVDFMDTRFSTAPWLPLIQLLIARLMRAFHQPEKRLMEGGSVGSWAALREQSEAVELIVMAYMDELGQQLTEQLLPPLVELNLPAGTTARIVFGAADRASMDVLKQLLDKVFNASSDEAMATIDVRAVLEALNVPTVSDEEKANALEIIRAKAEEKAKQQEEIQARINGRNPQAQESTTGKAEEGQGGLDAAIQVFTPTGSASLPRFDLAANKSLGKEFRRRLDQLAANWKPRLDGVLREQVRELIDKVKDILNRISDPIQQMWAIKDLTVSRKPYAEVLQELIKEAQAYGRSSMAIDTGKQVGGSTPYDEVRAAVLADGLSSDRRAILEKIVNVTALNTIHTGTSTPDTVYQIEDRARKILGELSNETTAVAEVWRGFNDGRQSVAAELVERAEGGDPDGIVAMTIHAAGGSCSLCNYLDGQTIRATHPNFWGWHSPHHHNCQCQEEYLTQQQLDELDPPDFRPPPASLLKGTDWYFTARETL